MSWFDYYISAFKKFMDYKNIATRKEFNFFILFTSVFYICYYGMSIPGYVGKIVEKFYHYGWGFEILLYSVPLIIHIVPILALIKRRLNDIFGPDLSGVFFITFLVLEIFSITFSLIIGPWFINSNLNEILGYISTVFLIFLMAKKGIN